VYDPVGFALAEQTLDAFFPPLEYVVSKSSGSLINSKYGPKVYVSKYETSVAFLATESLSDKNSLAARMLQARFTNCTQQFGVERVVAYNLVGVSRPTLESRAFRWSLQLHCDARVVLRPVQRRRRHGRARGGATRQPRRLRLAVRPQLAVVLCDHLHGEPEQGDGRQRAGGQRAFVVESTRHPPRALRARRGLTARGAARRNNARSQPRIARPCRPTCGAPTRSDWARATHSGTW